jgi:hypothetical protein
LRSRRWPGNAATQQKTMPRPPLCEWWRLPEAGRCTHCLGSASKKADGCPTATSACRHSSQRPCIPSAAAQARAGPAQWPHWQQRPWLALEPPRPQAPQPRALQRGPWHLGQAALQPWPTPALPLPPVAPWELASPLHASATLRCADAARQSSVDLMPSAGSPAGAPAKLSAMHGSEAQNNCSCDFKGTHTRTRPSHV